MWWRYTGVSLGMDPLQISGPPHTYRPHCTPSIRVGKLHLFAPRNKYASIFLPSNTLVGLLAIGEQGIRVLPVCCERGSQSRDVLSSGPRLETEIALSTTWAAIEIVAEAVAVDETPNKTSCTNRIEDSSSFDQSGLLAVATAENMALGSAPDELEPGPNSNTSSNESIEERCFAAALICLEGHYTDSPAMGPQTNAKVVSMVSRTLEKTHASKEVR